MEESKPNNMGDGVLTIKGIQDFADSISANSGRPDPPLLLDQKSFDAYKKIFNEINNLPKFEPGSWVFDGTEQFEVLRQNGPRLELARLNGIAGGVVAIRRADQLVQIPKGSKLETCKVLYGKQK